MDLDGEHGATTVQHDHGRPLSARDHAKLSAGVARRRTTKPRREAGLRVTSVPLCGA